MAMMGSSRGLGLLRLSAYVDAGERRLGHAVQHYRQQHDAEARHQAHAQFEVADAAQDQHAQARRRHERLAITTMARLIMIVWFTPAMMLGSASGICTP